jgi:hypothetical protein
MSYILSLQDGEVLPLLGEPSFWLDSLLIKSNGIINHKWADASIEWVSSCGLIELDPPNKLFTWTNNQNNLIMAKIDRVFISTNWEAAFP